jgi:uncharacterized membrane protein YtjA (UPF0391 family)
MNHRKHRADSHEPHRCSSIPKTPRRTVQWVRHSIDIEGLTACGGSAMLYYALIFLVIALIAGFFGFFGVAGLAASIAKVLFVVFVVLLIISLIMGRRRPPV